jgi:hypothetical protein
MAMLSTKELVLKTANHIEKNPRCYHYTSNRIPLCSDDVGCILGWMAHFSAAHLCGVLTPEAIARMTCDPLSACNVGYNHFFKRLDECYPPYRGHWRSDAAHAVAALRAYAARYPEALGLPVWARMRDREAAASQGAQISSANLRSAVRYSIAARSLALVQCGIGRQDHFFGQSRPFGSRALHSARSEARRDRYCRSGGDEGGSADTLTQSLRYCHGLGSPCFRQYDSKLLASNPRRPILPEAKAMGKAFAELA